MPSRLSVLNTGGRAGTVLLCSEVEVEKEDPEGALAVIRLYSLVSVFWFSIKHLTFEGHSTLDHLILSNIIVKLLKDGPGWEDMKRPTH